MQRGERHEGEEYSLQKNFRLLGAGTATSVATWTSSRPGATDKPLAHGRTVVASPRYAAFLAMSIPGV